MNQNSKPPDDSWESDAVWKLLAQAPPRHASDRFTENTMRALRLSEENQPWWSRLFSPAPLSGLAGLAGIAAVIIFTVTSWVGPALKPAFQLDSPQAVAIQDIAETETLLAAVDHMEDFTDRELVSLIGF